MFDLFAGLGGATSGFLAEGWHCIGIDIERHVYGEHRYPAQLWVQDILTVDGAQLRDADFIWASPPCFVADTLILTARGLVPIPEVLAGDLVFTHRKRWRRVLRTGSTVAPTVAASGHGGGLEGTAEHPIYVRRDEGSFKVWGKVEKAPVYRPKRLGAPSWVPLANVGGCHWASPSAFDPLPMPELPNGLPNTPEFWWIVGRWVGDGWVRLRETSGSGDEVIICCSHAEADDLEARLSTFARRAGVRAKSGELHWRRSAERTVARFTSASTPLARWLTGHFGRGAALKSWPAWALGMSQDHRQALLDGYASADGCEDMNSGARVNKTGSISKRLTIGTRLLAQSLGYPASVFHTPRPSTCKIEGRTVRQRDTWSVYWMPDSQGHRLVEHDDAFFWGKVRKIRSAQDAARVWNLEVDEDNSYLADGIVVHNCQEFSWMAMPWSRAKQVAAALRGEAEFPEGYRGSRTVEDLTRLFDACFRIQREACEAAGRHIPMVVENVKGAQPWAGRARWSFGSFFLWGDVPALMPPVRPKAMKVGVTRRHDGSTNFHKPWGAEAQKNAGGSWFAVSHNNVPHSRGDGVKAVGIPHIRDGEPHTRHLTNPAEHGVKQRGSGRAWFDKALDERRKNPDGLKNPGIELGDIGFNVASAHQFGHMVEGVKIVRGEREKRQHIGAKRKFASAMIAKIPEDLSRWIARAWYPTDRERPPCETPSSAPSAAATP